MSTGSIHTWLSQIQATQLSQIHLPTTPPSSLSSLNTSSPTKPIHVNKRKYDAEDDHNDQKRAHFKVTLTRQALRELSGNMGGSVGPQAANAAQKSSQKQSSSSSSNRASTSDPTSSNPAAKQTPNVHNVRQALAQHGMWYCEGEAFARCPEFKSHVFQIFSRDRGSRMQEDSYNKAVRYMEENATVDEQSYHEGLLPYVVKESRSLQSRKRNASDEVITVCKTFEADEMIRLKGIKFLNKFLPGQLDGKIEKKLGLSDANPDYTFGIRENHFPKPGTSPSDNVKAIIGVAPGMIHPWFVIENKGAEGSLSECQNQALRDGATMVNARIQLNAKATTTPKPVGADMDAIAFSCTWIPQMAELYVHWFEKQDAKTGIFHMHRLGNYMLDRRDELTQFRHDVHNILDWGVLTNKREAEAVVTKIISKTKAASTTGS
ncbi:MAG: hypothetical protein Q9217_001044 [Psora testacea]